MVVDWSGDMSKSFEREHHFTYHFVAFRFSPFRDVLLPLYKQVRP